MGGLFSVTIGAITTVALVYVLLNAKKDAVSSIATTTTQGFAQVAGTFQGK